MNDEQSDEDDVEDDVEDEGEGEGVSYDAPEPERSLPPTYSSNMKKWNHPIGGSCTCGCNGGWSSSEKGIK